MKPDFLGQKVVAAFSSREFDASRRGDFFKSLPVFPERLCRLKQTHGNQIFSVKDPQSHSNQSEGDALLTSIPGVALFVLTADCLPVFFSDPDKKVVGIAHAGWRGLQAQILPRMLARMEQDYDCQKESVRVYFGPGIRKCCYEVGPEFREHFPGFYEPKGKKGALELTQVARTQLVSKGILSKHIADSELCTGCQNRTYFSARKEKTVERIVSTILLRPL